MGRRPPIANRIRELREEHGHLTQAPLAEADGVTRQTVIAIERNRYAPSLEGAFRIARVFGLGREEVFQWQG